MIYRNHVSIVISPLRERKREGVFNPSIRHDFCKSYKSSPNLSLEKGEESIVHFLKIAFSIG